LLRLQVCVLRDQGGGGGGDREHERVPDRQQEAQGD
jgi:hypothetical protein